MVSDGLRNIWPEWQIVRRIGSGSFGVVYEAVRRNYSVESHAAIKVISIPQHESEIDSLRSEGMSEDSTRIYLESMVNDFVSEIRLMESFKGIQNIVCVEDYEVVEKKDEIGWEIYIRMELLTPFNSYIRDRTLTEREVIKLGVDICTALEFCAKRNVIHRDIKPENIFINQFGDFKLGDFGIARKLENVTGGLSQKGTYNYMAPEIEKGMQYDATVDLYSLGLVLYQLMNKKRLPFLDTECQIFSHSDRMTAIRRRMDGEPLPVPCEASSAMAQIILCACSADVGRRFTSATEMKNALISVEKGTYYGYEDMLNKTVTVRHAVPVQDPDKTTSVRNASYTQKTVETFGEKKRSRAPAIIMCILAAVLLAGGVMFAAMKLFNDNKIFGEDNTEDNSAETVAEKEKIIIFDNENSVYSDWIEEENQSDITGQEQKYVTGESALYSSGSYAMHGNRPLYMYIGYVGGKVYEISNKTIVYVDSVLQDDEDCWGHINYYGIEGYVRLSAMDKIDDRDYSIKAGTECYISNPYNKGIALRASTSTDSELYIRIPYGTELEVEEFCNGWGKFTYEGYVGWIIMDCISTYYNNVAYKVDTSADYGIHFREAPAKAAARITDIPNGETVYFTEFCNGWGKTSYAGQEGWLSMGYLRPVGE